ncbi:hypothetical protein ES703_72071 [subsurface metagenome]
MPGRVADTCGVVADDKHSLVAEVLKLPHLPQYYRVAEMYIGTGGVQAELDAKLSACFSCLSEFFGQFFLGKNLNCAAS